VDNRADAVSLAPWSITPTSAWSSRWRGPAPADVAAPGSQLQCSRSDARWSRWWSSVRYIEYRIIGGTCVCGRAQRSTFPAGIEAPV